MNFNFSQILVIFLELSNNLVSAGSSQAKIICCLGKQEDLIVVDVFEKGSKVFFLTKQSGNLDIREAEEPAKLCSLYNEVLLFPGSCPFIFIITVDNLPLCRGLRYIEVCYIGVSLYRQN